MARILIVDDNSQNRYLLEVLFRASGHDVRAAGNGAEALASALAEPPDVVISDLLMPVMDGFTLCHAWKSDERLAEIPFVVYTATFTEQKDEELARSFGADRFVRKPQEPEVLLHLVEGVLSEARPRGAAKPGVAPHEETARMKRYSEALFNKLEQKMAEVQAKNERLERALAERAQGEEALRASEAKYRIVADNTYSWEFWADPEGGLKYVSPSCERVTGHDCGEFARDPGLLERAVHADDWPRLKAHIDGVERQRGEGSLEVRVMHADGSQRWIVHDCAPVFDQNGVWLGTRGSNRDVTEQKRIEAQLRHAQKMEAIGQLAGGVAHDFNNILTAILGYTEILQMKMRGNDTLCGYLDQVVAAAERAANLTGSLLLFSRKQEMKPQAVDLNGIIRNVLKFLQRIIGEDVQIRTNLWPEPITVFADSGQVEQVLMNLATNARDAMSAGGVLSIETDVVEIDPGYINAHGYGTPGRYAMLSVSDNGIGMDEATRQRAFEPFFTTKEPGRGTGLGLSIVYSIVKQHNGYIDVYSEPGRGTTFRLLFKVIEAEAAGRGAKEPESARSQTGAGETILVVDDEASIRQMLEVCLAELGYRVILAENGQAAVETFRAKSGAIDLVIMDTIMPKKGGKETSEEIRSLRPEAKILLMSGYPSQSLHSLGVLVEGVEFIPKPLRPTELARKVKSMLKRA